MAESAPCMTGRALCADARVIRPTCLRLPSRSRITSALGDADAVHDAAVQYGATVVYPPTNEPWGVRRYFVADPDGAIVNVMTRRTME